MLELWVALASVSSLVWGFGVEAVGRRLAAHDDIRRSKLFVYQHRYLGLYWKLAPAQKWQRSLVVITGAAGVAALISLAFTAKLLLWRS